MRIYLDACVYNRPYDDLSQMTVNAGPSFDYTGWQREHYDRIQPDELYASLQKYSETHHFKGKKAVMLEAKQG